MQLISSETRDVISTQPINKQISSLSNEDARSIQELSISQSPEPERSLPPLDIAANSAPNIVISSPDSQIIFGNTSNIENELTFKSKSVTEITSEALPIEIVDNEVQQKSNDTKECEIDSSEVPAHVTAKQVISDDDSEFKSLESDLHGTVDSSLTSFHSTVSQTKLNHGITTEIADEIGHSVIIEEITTFIEPTQSQSTQEHLTVSAQNEQIQNLSEINSPQPSSSSFQFDVLNRNRKIFTPQNSVDESVLLQEHSTKEAVKSADGSAKMEITESTLLAVAEKVSKSETIEENPVVSTRLATGSHTELESSKTHEETITTVQVTSTQTSSFETKVENNGNFVVISEMEADENGPSALEATEGATVWTVVKSEPQMEVKSLNENQSSTQFVTNTSTDIESSSSQFREETTSSKIRIVSCTEKVSSSKVETSGESIETTIATGALPSAFLAPDNAHIQSILSKPSTLESKTITNAQHTMTTSTVTSSSETAISSSEITSSTEASSAVNFIYSEILNDQSGSNGISSKAAIESGIVRPPLYEAPNHVWSELLQAQPTKIETYLSAEASPSKSTAEAVNGN